MTPEERIAQLEAEVASLRRITEAQASALAAATARLQQEGDAARLLLERREAARLKKQRQRAMDGLSRDPVAAVSPGQSRDNGGTTLPPPLKGSPPPSIPSSPSPISSPPSLFPPSSVASVRPAKKAKEAKKPDTAADPRHSPLVAELTAIGFPFDGGKDAKNVETFLKLCDQQEATKGDGAAPEVLRRARIAWNQFPGFHSARTLSGLRSKWGEFAQPDTGRNTGPPDVTRGSLRAEMFDHSKPDTEPF